MDRSSQLAGVSLQAPTQALCCNHTFSHPLGLAPAVIKHGATVDKKTKVTREHRNERFEGFTPLHAACRLGHTNLAVLLIDASADVNSRGVWHAIVGDGSYNEGKDDLSDVTPLHMAIAYHHSKLAVKLLKDHGAVTSLREGGKRWPGKRLKHTDEFLDPNEGSWERHSREQRSEEEKENLMCTLALAVSTSVRDMGRVLKAISAAAKQLAEHSECVLTSADKADPLRWLLSQPLPEPPKRDDSSSSSRQSLLYSIMERQSKPKTPEEIAEQAAARREIAADELLVRATYDAARSGSVAGVGTLLPHLQSREGGQPLVERRFNDFIHPSLAPLPLIRLEDADGDLCTILLLAALAGETPTLTKHLLSRGVQPRTEANAELLLTAALMHDEMAAGNSTVPRTSAGPLLSILVNELKPQQLAETGEVSFISRQRERRGGACCTPLHVAMLVGNIGAISKLARVTCLKQPPLGHSDKLDADGLSPVHYAAMGRFRVTEPNAAEHCFGGSPYNPGFVAQHFQWIGAPASDHVRGAGAKRQCTARPAGWTAACSDRGESSAVVLRELGSTCLPCLTRTSVYSYDGNQGQCTCLPQCVERRLQRFKQHLRCVDRGHLEGSSPLELAVQGRRDKVVAELLQKPELLHKHGTPIGQQLGYEYPRENVESALATVRQQISSGTARSVSLNPANPGKLLKLAKVDVDVARSIEGMLLHELDRQEARGGGEAI